MYSVRWFRRIAGLFAAFQVVGCLAALVAGFMWARTVTQSAWPPQSFIYEAVLSALVATLAFWATTASSGLTSKLWWSAITLSVVDLVLALFRYPDSVGNWVELVGVAAIAVLSGLTLRSKATLADSPGPS